MIWTRSASASAKRGERGARRRARPLGVCAAGFLLALAFADRASADWLDTTGLRGTLSPQSYSRWDGVNFGATFGFSNMNTDFGNSASSLIAYSLRDTTIESELAPSNWTTLPNTTTNGRQYGGFIGYNMQWEQLVIGFQGAYNRVSSLQTSASDHINRISTTSDTYANTIDITAQSSVKLIDYATFGARLGYAMGQFLPYAVIGGAAGRFNYATTETTIYSGTSTTANPPSYGPNSDTQSNSKNNAVVGGFMVGLGVDVAVLPNVFLRAEWEFVAFAPVGGIRTDTNTGRVGVGIKF
ncbi:MAG: outer membrane beta-barrel protein [Pseudolabrys sp.]|jgi:opacity protein-like surface antigen